jgi:hypothetical protein
MLMKIRNYFGRVNCGGRSARESAQTVVAVAVLARV